MKQIQQITENFTKIISTNPNYNENHLYVCFKKQMSKNIQKLVQIEVKMYREAPLALLAQGCKEIKELDLKGMMVKFKEKLTKEDQNVDFKMEIYRGRDLKKLFEGFIEDFQNLQDDDYYVVIFYDLKVWSKTKSLMDLYKLQEFYEKEPNYQVFQNPKAKTNYIKGDPKKCDDCSFNYDLLFNKLFEINNENFLILSKGSELTFILAPKVHLTNDELIINIDCLEYIERVIKVLESKFKLELDSIALNFNNWESRNSFQLDNQLCHGHVHIKYKEKGLDLCIQRNPNLFSFRMQKKTYVKDDLNLLEKIIVNKRMDKIEQRMDKLEERMDKLEQRMDKLEERMDKLEQRMDKLEQKMDTLIGMVFVLGLFQIGWIWCSQRK